jgi:CopG family nickel-responsive transcriptional regulator
MEDELKRFGVSMDGGLLEKFDRYLLDHAYTNRSEGIRDLIRKALVAEEWVHDRETVGAVNIVYDHHVPELNRKLTQLQHDFPGQVIASMHVHLDHDNCMEVIVAKGKATDIKVLADKLIALRGVLHGTLTGSTVGAPFKHEDLDHGHDPRDHPHPHPHDHGSED